MTADGRLPLAERRNYSGVFNALLRITREEGVFTLWRGCIPTMGRAMVVNAAQLASYTQVKQYLIGTGYFTEGIKLHFVASMVSGFITTVASMPVDIAKTRLQNMKVSADGKAEYRGTVDVLSRVVRQEGLFALWKGFVSEFLCILLYAYQIYVYASLIPLSICLQPYTFADSVLLQVCFMNVLFLMIKCVLLTMMIFVFSSTSTDLAPTPFSHSFSWSNSIKLITNMYLAPRAVALDCKYINLYYQHHQIKFFQFPH